MSEKLISELPVAGALSSTDVFIIEQENQVETTRLTLGVLMAHINTSIVIPADLTDRVEAIELTVGGHTVSLGQINDQLQVIDGDISELEQALANEVELRNGQFDNISLSISTIGGDVAILQSTVSDIELTISGHADDILALQNAVAGIPALTGRVEAVEGSVSSLEGDLSDEVLARVATTNEVVAARGAYPSLSERIADISAAVGEQGKSAYQVAVDNGFVGTEAEWLASLVGPEGPAGRDGVDGTNGQDGAPGLPGADGVDGTNGQDGAPGLPGADGADGADGKSAYQVALDNGFVGTEAEWLASLVGPEGPAGRDGVDGTNGQDGADGADGADGKSAYQVAVDNGFVGNEAEWLASLVGPEGPAGRDGVDGTNGQDGADGASAYQIALNNGFVGTETEWLASLIGPQGIPGEGGGGVPEDHEHSADDITSGVLTIERGGTGGEGFRYVESSTVPTNEPVGTRWLNLEDGREYTLTTTGWVQW